MRIVPVFSFPMKRLLYPACLMALAAGFVYHRIRAQERAPAGSTRENPPPS